MAAKDKRGGPGGGITVLAGVNGAGKSSIAGCFVREQGGEYYNPDEIARTAKERKSSLTQEDANAYAWAQGKRLLEEAIKNRSDFIFETTLGGSTITGLLVAAARQGIPVRVWFTGLSSPELHLQRVAERVKQGGHHIPEGDIRKRWINSRENLIRLLPFVTELSVYDNSAEADPWAGQAPTPTLVLQVTGRALTFPPPDKLAATPNWAKPIVLAAYAELVKRPPS